MTMIISWVATKLGINTLLASIITYAVIGTIVGAGAFWWLKVHDAKIADKYKREGIMQGIEQQRKENEVRWNKLLTDIDKERKEYSKLVDELKTFNIALAKSVDEWKQKYNAVKNNVNTQIIEIPKIVEVIPKSELIDSIRVKSGALVLPTPITNIEKTGVLSETEGRIVLGQILELEVRRDEVVKLESLIKEDELLDMKRKESCDLEITAVNKKYDLLLKEHNVTLEKAQFFESSYNTCKKGRSGLCWFFKIVTLGMAKCL